MRPGLFSITLLDQANNPNSTVQALRGVYVFNETVPFVYSYNHYPGPPGLNMVINPYKLALLPTASID